MIDWIFETKVGHFLFVFSIPVIIAEALSWNYNALVIGAIALGLAVFREPKRII